MTHRIAADRVLAIAGPTASGKSALAMELCARYGAELISCDSMQIYRGCDVGTAKPTADDRARVCHHLVDVASPDERYSAARWAVEAAAAIADATSRGKPVIVVGGTGLYLRALRYGLVDAPPCDETLRERLLETERVEAGALHRRLLEVDAIAAAKIAPRDLVRLVRALEVFELTGTPISQLHQSQGDQEQVPMRVLVLDPPVDELTQRITDRTEQMLRGGIIEETRRLRLDFGAGIRPLGAVGYAEVSAFLDGTLRSAELASAIVRATRQYAKRQRTWWRKEPDAGFYPTVGALLDAEAERLSAMLAA